MNWSASVKVAFCSNSLVLRYLSRTMVLGENLDLLRSTRTRIAKPTVPSNSRLRAPTVHTLRTSPSTFLHTHHYPPSDKPRFLSPSSKAGVGDVGVVGSKSGVGENKDTEGIRDWSRYFGDVHPLRVVFIGHNPSEASWNDAAPYAHPTNWFWRLVKECGVIPPALCAAEKHRRLPGEAGVGFIDLFVTSGSDSSLVRKDALRKKNKKDDGWRDEFLARLKRGNGGVGPVALVCVSKVVAKKLLVDWDGGRSSYGFVGYGAEWRLIGAEKSEVWVLPSTSGRAQLKREDRLAPFRQLADRLAREPPWEPPSHEEPVRE